MNKQLEEALSLTNEKMEADILGILEAEKPQPIEIAAMIADAYRKGTDLFWKSYQSELETNNKLRAEIARIKDRMYNDYLEGR